MPYLGPSFREDLAAKQQIFSARLNIGDNVELVLSDVGDANASEPRVIQWNPIRYAIDVIAPDVGRTETSVVVADTDGYIRNWLTSENMRGQLAYITWWDTQGESASLFRGILDSWDYAPGKVTLKLKSDDRWMRTYVPRVKILKSEHPSLTGVAQEYYDTYIPVVYGSHLSTSLGQTGMLPAFPLKTFASATAGAVYAVNLGQCRSYRVGGTTTGNLAVYKNGVAVTLGASDTVGFYLIGGKSFYVVYFGTTTTVDTDVITVDMDGSAAAYGAYDMVSNPVEQLRNFLVDHVFNEYKSGAYPHESGLDGIDDESWADCIAIAEGMKLEGTLYVGGSKDQRQARDVVSEWLASWPMFRLYIAPSGLLKIVFVSLKHPGYPSENELGGALVDPRPGQNEPGVISSEDVLADSYEVQLDAYNIVDRISCDHTFSELAGPLRSFEVQDMNIEENIRESVSLINAPRKV